jgi:hypothetical protein
VFAYGGAMIFPEIVNCSVSSVHLTYIEDNQMAEMRRPMDFWKGMVSLSLRLRSIAMA